MVSRMRAEIEDDENGARPHRPPPHVRFATLRNQLQRIAHQCCIQLHETGPIIPVDISQAGGIAWRLNADCFSIVISAVPPDGFSLPPGTIPPEDYPIVVAAVHFEFNHEKSIVSWEVSPIFPFSLARYLLNICNDEIITRF